MGSKLIATLVPIFRRILLCVPFWFLAYLFACVAASSAKMSPNPNPQLGRTYHVHAIWAGRNFRYDADGYVKPWVGHFYHFVTTLGMVLLIAAVVLMVVLFIARSITGEWPERDNG
jgi:hypothetical protein